MLTAPVFAVLSLTAVAVLYASAGLAGQPARLGGALGELLESAYLVLPLAVLIDGQFGSRVDARLLDPALVRRITGLVVSVVAVRLLCLS